MKFHWLIKYYIVVFIGIFSVAYYIEKSEPYVNWELYPQISEIELKQLILNKECEAIIEIYEAEYNANYEKNFFGFIIRKDKQLVRGLKLLKYLRHNINKINCIQA
tara:strand:+ start:110 stop:427 length:318 start_codon:yes stop_codon:yes gene_type:complete